MFWSTINFRKLVRLMLPTFLRKAKMLAFYEVLVSPLQVISDETLYKMQHNGATIYLEKMLNESYKVVGYDYQNHDTTKLIYIDDLAATEKLYIFQNEEDETTFLEDDEPDSEDDVFLEGDNEGKINYSWIIYMPNTIPFDEFSLRALVDSYRYIGKKYKIETYTI